MTMKVMLMVMLLLAASSSSSCHAFLVIHTPTTTTVTATTSSSSTSSKSTFRIVPTVSYTTTTRTPTTTTTTCLFTKKKKSSSSSSSKSSSASSSSTTSTSGNTKQLLVQLLKPVPGTGQPGDIVSVAPAFFTNKLQPSNLAKIITQEQVEQQRAKAQQFEQDLLEKGKTIQSILLLQEEDDDDNDDKTIFTITIQGKAGPEGQLFGGINPKMIVSELQQVVLSKLPSDKAPAYQDFFNQKFVKLTSLMVDDHDNGNQKKVPGDMIKHTGWYTAQINLSKDQTITAKFGISVEPL